MPQETLASRDYISIAISLWQELPRTESPPGPPAHHTPERTQVYCLPLPDWTTLDECSIYQVSVTTAGRGT